MTLHTGIPEIDNARATPIVGSDEVGLGAWCGELVICAVAVPCDWEPNDPLIRDSKQLSPAQREKVYEKWWNKAQTEQGQNLVISLGIIEVCELNEYPIHDCLKRAHRLAIEGTFWRLPCRPLIVVDGIVNPYDDPKQSNLTPPYSTWVERVFCLPKADSLVPAVALASIIAKVTRDRMMAKWAEKYPGYGFEKHRGYGTSQHQKALAELGPCPIHRKTYAPIRKLLEAKPQEAREKTIEDLIAEIADKE